MGKLLITGIITLVSLVVGYKFFYHYDAIDRRLFGRGRDNYESFGLMQLLFSGMLGAIYACAPVADELFGLGLQMRDTTYSVTLLFVVVLSFNLYDSISRLEGAGARLGKFLFLTLLCMVGFGFGMLGSVAMLVLCTTCFLILLMQRIRGTAGACRPTAEPESAAWKFDTNTRPEDFLGSNKI